MKFTSDLEYNNAFAKNLRTLLEHHPKTQKPTTKTALAYLLGVKQQTVSQWADGSTTPTLKNLIGMAEYFEISIDELATGVSYGNKDLYNDTGLSDKSINILKALKADKRFSNEIIIEFFNMFIETITPSGYIPSLINCSIEYILGAHEYLLFKNKVTNKDVLSTYNPDAPEDSLDFKTFQLIKVFERFIESLTIDVDTWNRLIKLYERNGVKIPLYGLSGIRYYDTPNIWATDNNESLI